VMNPSTSSTLSDGPPEDGEDLVPTKTQVLPAEETDGTQGGQVFGRFRLLMEMGEGGMATLFLARIRGPKMFEKMVAIKRIHGHLTGNEEFVDMFLDEARIAALIHHPNVVNTFDLGIIDGSHFIAMEYVHGQTLLDLFKKSLRLQVPIPWEHAVRIVADAAAGLHAAHELKTSAGESMGVVHRDVSPQNILISYEGHVKVVDFGIAYATEKLSHTKTGMVRGKVPYMSPEQTRSEPLDRRSDIFSLGIVLYELVCMKRLFKASSESESLRLVRAAHMELLPREIRSELPVALEKVIVQCLAREPEARYASAGDLAEALEALLIRDGKAVSSQSFARFMDRMFHTQRKLKDVHGSDVPYPAEAQGRADSKGRQVYYVDGVAIGGHVGGHELSRGDHPRPSKHEKPQVRAAVRRGVGGGGGCGGVDGPVLVGPLLQGANHLFGSIPIGGHHAVRACPDIHGVVADQGSTCRRQGTDRLPGSVLPRLHPQVGGGALRENGAPDRERSRISDREPAGGAGDRQGDPGEAERCHPRSDRGELHGKGSGWFGSPPRDSISRTS